MSRADSGLAAPAAPPADGTAPGAARGAAAGVAPAPATPAGAAPAARARGPVPAWFRLLRSELALVFLRWRNLLLLVALAVLPAVLGVALRLATPRGGGGPASSFMNQLAGNGVFLAFIALTIMLTLVLPLAIAVVSGDSIAGEAGIGSLRYLLTVPVGRARLLSVKYAAIVVYGLAASVVVSGVALLAGVALFPVGPVTLLSGNTVPLSQGLLRLLLVTLFVAAAMAALGAVGLAISTFTEHPIGAIAAVLVLAVASEVTDQVPQFSAIHPYLPTHWWLSFDSLLRSPIATGDLLHSLLSFGVYAVIFGSVAWARFSTADVTS